MTKQNGFDFKYFRTTPNGIYIYADENGFLYYRRKNGEFRQISYMNKNNKVERLTVKDVIENKKNFYLGSEKIESKNLKSEGNLDFDSPNHRLRGDVNNVIASDPTSSQNEEEVLTKVGTLSGNGINGFKDIYIDKSGFLYVMVLGGFVQLSYYDTKTGIEVPITELNYDTVGGRLNYYNEDLFGGVGRNAAFVKAELNPIYLDSENIVYKIKSSEKGKEWKEYIFFDKEKNEYYVYDNNQRIVLEQLTKNGELYGFRRKGYQDGNGDFGEIYLSNYKSETAHKIKPYSGMDSVQEKVYTIDLQDNDIPPVEAEYDFAYDSDKLEETIKLIENKKKQ